MTGVQTCALPICAWSGGNLANSGERITLVDGAGSVIHSFAYDDREPWPTAADGDGPSLELVDPQSAPDHSLAASWRASAPGCTPGNGGEPVDPGLLDFALGADLLGVPAESLISVGTITALGQEFITFTYRRRSDAPDVSYLIEVSSDLRTWDPTAGFPGLEETDHGDGTKSITVRSNFTVGSEKTKYVRLKVARIE